MFTRQQQQAAADEMRKYLLPDCLKPEFDGMTSFEIAGKILAAADWVGREEVTPESIQSEREAYQNAH